MEAALLEPETQIKGAVIMFDMDGLSLQQTWQFTPPFAKRIVDLLQVKTNMTTIKIRQLINFVLGNRTASHKKHPRVKSTLHLQYGLRHI